jgi:hypothetical protein
MTVRSWWNLSGPIEAATVLLLGILGLTLGIVLNVGWLFVCSGPLTGVGLGASIRSYPRLVTFVRRSGRLRERGE